MHFHVDVADLALLGLAVLAAQLGDEIVVHPLGEDLLVAAIEERDAALVARVAKDGASGAWPSPVESFAANSSHI